MFDWRKLKAHPEADKFPLMAGMDLVNLAGNIQAKGQVFPIIITDEEKPCVLDGRNRLAAFRMLESEGAAHKEPWIETYSGDMSPKDYVRAVNWERMHLNGAQRAALAAEMIADKIVGTKLKEEAKAAQLSGLKKGKDSPSPSTEGHGNGTSYVAVKVAEKMGVSRAQVERADRVRRESEDGGFQRLKDGKSTVNAEYSKLPKEPTKKEKRTAADASFIEKLSGFFKAAGAFRGLVLELKILTNDIPKTLDERERSQYLSAAMALQEELHKQLSILIRKLQS